MCDWGLDCSGLVHLSLRRLGVVFPRDADDQDDACERISAADARPGDLNFFADEGKRAHRVGIVTEPRGMLHAPETGSLIVEEAPTQHARTASSGPDECRHPRPTRDWRNDSTGPAAAAGPGYWEAVPHE